MPRPLLAFAVAFAFAATASGQEFAANHLIGSALDGDKIRELDLNGNLIRDFGSSAGLNQPASPAFGPNGHLYVMNAGTATVVEFDGGGAKVKELGASAGIASPGGFAFGPDGNLFITSQFPSRVVEIDSNGNKIRDIGVGSGLGAPQCVTFSPDGHLWVSSASTNSIFEFDSSGAKVREITDAALLSPTSMHFGPDGTLYVLSPPAMRIFVFSADGSLSHTIGENLAWSSPAVMIPGPDANLYVLDPALNQIFVINAGGVLVRNLGGVGSQQAPSGICISPIRFSAKLTGGRIRPGGPQGALKDSAIVSIFPGAQTAMLQTSEANLKNKNSVAAHLGRTTFVFRGYDRFIRIAPPARHFEGAEFPLRSVSKGAASLSLESGGFEDSGGAYSPYKAKGTFHASSGLAIVAALVSPMKRIN